MTRKKVVERVLSKWKEVFEDNGKQAVERVL